MVRSVPPYPFPELGRVSPCAGFLGIPDRPLPAGVLDFIPLMRISYDWTPSKPFGLLGYQMFAFLFNWTDVNWVSVSVKTRKGERTSTILTSLSLSLSLSTKIALAQETENVPVHAVARLVGVHLLVDGLQRLLDEGLRARSERREMVR